MGFLSFIGACTLLGGGGFGCFKIGQWLKEHVSISYTFGEDKGPITAEEMAQKEAQKREREKV